MPRGDFNMVRFLVERRGATRLTSGMRDFSKFISEIAMLDLALEGDALLGPTIKPPPKKKINV